MDLGIKGKKALVLGSSRGLGLGIAKALLAEGAELAICGRNAAELSELAQALSTQYQSSVLAIPCDLNQESAPNILFNTFIENFHQIDILVNNSGGPPAMAAEKTVLPDWQNHFSQMVHPLIALSSLAIPYMRQQQWGRILTLASSGVIQPIPGLVLSNVLRSALLAWNKSLALEVAKEGITVNTLIPGKILTSRLRAINQAMAEKKGKSLAEMDSEVLSSIPMGRYGEIEEFADVATFFLSQKASYVTGSCILVDGGLVRAI